MLADHRHSDLVAALPSVACLAAVLTGLTLAVLYCFGGR